MTQNIPARLRTAVALLQRKTLFLCPSNDSDSRARKRFVFHYRTTRRLEAVLPKVGSIRQPPRLPRLPLKTEELQRSGGRPSLSASTGYDPHFYCPQPAPAPSPLAPCGRSDATPRLGFFNCLVAARNLRATTSLFSFQSSRIHQTRSVKVCPPRYRLTLFACSWQGTSSP